MEILDVGRIGLAETQYGIDGSVGRHHRNEAHDFAAYIESHRRRTRRTGVLVVDHHWYTGDIRSRSGLVVGEQDSGHDLPAFTRVDCTWPRGWGGANGTPMAPTAPRYAAP